MHICVTHVDARTGVPCDVAPMRKGPAFPNVKGLVIQWFNQTEWPTDKPLFYGTCDDDADLTVAGIVSVLSEQEYTMLWDTEKATVINQIRARRADTYTNEADPIFFKSQRGEAEIAEWEAKVDEIRLRYPYPETEEATTTP